MWYFLLWYKSPEILFQFFLQPSKSTTIFLGKARSLLVLSLTLNVILGGQAVAGKHLDKGRKSHWQEELKGIPWLFDDEVMRFIFQNSNDLEGEIIQVIHKNCFEMFYICTIRSTSNLVCENLITGKDIFVHPVPCTKSKPYDSHCENS